MDGLQVMDPLAHRVAARYAAQVVPFKPKPHGPKIEIGGKHYVLSTDSGPPMGDLAENLTHANKWRYLWAYNTDAQVVAMWRVSDGDEKVYDNAKHASPQIIKLDKKGQLNRVSEAEFRSIESFMRKRGQETIEALKKVVEENKTESEKNLDELVRQYFDQHVMHHIERAISDVKRGVIPFGFKPYDPKAEHASIQRQAASFVIGQIFKREMSPPKVEAYLRQHNFDLESVHLQSIEWAIGDVQDAAFETYLPPR